jgi:glycosyltransferase involved in cell wall biosynthesis
VGWINTLGRDSDRYINTYIATNEKIKLTLVSRYKIAQEKIRVIYPILQKKCEFISTPPSVPTHVLIGRMDQQKRIDRFIELATNVSSLGFLDKFLAYGTGESLVQKQIHSFRLSNLIFKGKSDLHAIQQNQSSLILLSDFEGMPMVVLEALSAGIPVFATNVGDLDLLRDSLSDESRDYLYLIPPESDNAFILDSFLAWRRNLGDLWDSEDRVRLSQKIYTNFSVTKSTAEHERVFGDLK